MIDGVVARELVPHRDDRGTLTEMLRSDWPEFRGFGQAIVTFNRPGVVRAWHWHDRQTDVIVPVHGIVVVPLYDGRPSSPTAGRVDEYVVGDGVLLAITVPPGVYHGYKTIGPETAIIVNLPDHAYDARRPDEHRVPFDDGTIPYVWPTQRR